MPLRTFIYAGDLYVRCIPAKSLFKSSMVHEVVNRGDIFAIRVSDQVLTIVPGTAQVDHTSHQLIASAAQIAKEMKEQDVGTTNKTPATGRTRKATATARQRLKELAAEIRHQPVQCPLFGNL